AAIVSAVRVHAGDEVRPGQVLLEVSGRPLVVLPGAVPAYRDLKPGDSGADVKQLQTALAGLGHFSGPANGQFGQSTKDAITRFYEAIGYDVPTTGGPQDAGDRVALQTAHDAVLTAKRALDDVNRQIAAATTTGPPPDPHPSASPGPVTTPADLA